MQASPKNPLFVSLISLLSLMVGVTACVSAPSAPPPAGPPVNLHGDERVTYTQRIALPSPYAKIAFTYRGRGNFIVKAHYEEIGYDLAVTDTLVNAIGDYQGMVFVASKEPVAFEITADDGTWDAAIEGVGETGHATGWEGKGDSVSDFFEPPQDKGWRIVHTGTSNFIVQVFCLQSSQKSPETTVVNAIGKYADTVKITFDGAPCLWIVNADGEWSIRLEE